MNPEIPWQTLRPLTGQFGVDAAVAKKPASGITASCSPGPKAAVRRVECSFSTLKSSTRNGRPAGGSLVAVLSCAFQNCGLRSRSKESQIPSSRPFRRHEAIQGDRQRRWLYKPIPQTPRHDQRTRQRSASCEGPTSCQTDGDNIKSRFSQTLTTSRTFLA